MGAREIDGIFPEVKQWWEAHRDDKTIVVVRCGKPGCGKKVADIKRDGESIMIRRRVIKPEPTVRRPAWAGPDRDKHVLRTIFWKDGVMQVMKQHRHLPDVVAPIEYSTIYWCPKHGDMHVDRDKLTEFVRHADEAASMARRTFWA